MSNTHRYILFGIQGAGKGTQASMLAEKLGVPHIAMGDILREEMAAETKLGLEARSYLDAGNLVPDDLIMPIIKGRLSQEDCARGFILDGFPRKLSQAQKLQGVLEELGTPLDQTVCIDISKEELLRRLADRVVCSKCGAIYSLSVKPPQQAGVCDVCGGELKQRDDDQDREAIESRIRNYHEQTGAAIEYYDGLGLLSRVDGEQSIDQVQQAIVKVLQLA